MKYKVPQDVQREDTIIGPLTLKQMGILAAGGGVAYALYVSLAKDYFMEIWLPPVAIVTVITLAFAFLKIHSMPFYLFIMNYLEYKILPTKRTWIQGSDTYYPSEIDLLKPKKKKKKVEKMKNKQSIEELSNILDQYGKTDKIDTSDKKLEITEKTEKKKGLNKIINQNYKK